MRTSLSVTPSTLQTKTMRRNSDRDNNITSFTVEEDNSPVPDASSDGSESRDVFDCEGSEEDNEEENERSSSLAPKPSQPFKKIGSRSI